MKTPRPAVAGLYRLRGRTISPEPSPTSQTSRPNNLAIQSDADLISAEKDFDNTDLNSLNKELNQNDTDLASF